MMLLYPCWVFAADSVCGDYNSSLNSTVKTYLLHCGGMMSNPLRPFHLQIVVEGL